MDIWVRTVVEMSQFTKHPVIVDAVITPSGWRITDDKGEIILLSDHTFRALYFPVGKDKCTFCKHGRRHKTSDAVCDRHEVCLFAWKEGKDD